MEIIVRKCSRCKELKEIDANFYFVEASGYFDSYCKKCRSDINKERHRKNPNDSKERVRRSRKNTKLIKIKNVNTLY